MRRVIFRFAALIYLAGTAIAGAQTTLFTSAFDGNTGAVVLSGNTDNTSGSTSLVINDWTHHASVTAISGLTAISAGDGGTLGGFAQLQGGTATFANSNCVYLSRNHNLDTDRSTSRRGFSLTFTVTTDWPLTTLTVHSGHTTNTGNQDQAYASTLAVILSGGTLSAPVTNSSVQDYGAAPAYHSVAFDLTGTTIGPGTYTLEVYQTQMTGGGAYAIYDGITLEAYDSARPNPVINSFTANHTYVTAGANVILSWETTNATSLVIEPGVGDVTALTTNGAGNENVLVNETTTFTLTATNTNGVVTQNLNIAAGPPRPNLVVFLLDDFGPQDLSVPFCLDTNGNPVAKNFNSFYKTPNMEKLADSGMRFTSAYAQVVCSPTRCGIMTGRISARHGVTDWIGGGGAGSPTNWRSNGLDGTDVTLPQLLKAGGYRTIHIGKAHFGSSGHYAQYPTAIGFDVNVAGFDWGHPHAGYMGSPAYGGMPGMEAYDGSMFLTRALTIEANKAIENAVNEGRPFFLNMCFYATHAPFTLNPDATNDYTGAVNSSHYNFATMVEGVDIAIGQIRQKLVDLGVAKNTFIIFLGDNGSDSPALTVDGMPSGSFSDYPVRGKKGSRWEGGSLVPMIACWAQLDPGNAFQQALPIATNSVEKDIVTSWDVPVTLLAEAGLSGTNGFGEDGYDLRPYLAGIPGTHRPQELISHYPHVSRSQYFTWIRKDNMKLIYNYVDNSRQLYNLAVDPTESNDLAASQPETVMRLTRELCQKLNASWGPAGVLRPTVATTAPNGNVVSIPNDPAIDIDGDGLPDVQEDVDLNGLVAPTETDPDKPDTDGDGTQDGAEVRTGTDPLNPASSFIGVPFRTPTNGLSITWPSKPGASYEIQTSTNLTDWSESAIGPLPADTNATSTTHTLTSMDDTARFFRVVLLP